MTRFGLSTQLFGQIPLGARELDLVASHGFPLVEIAAGPGHFDVLDLTAAAETRARAIAAGLEVAGLAVALTDAVAGLDAAAALGSPRLIARAAGCRGHASSARAAPPSVGEFRRALEGLVDVAAARSVRVAAEIPQSISAEDAADLIESLEGTAVGVCLDTGHAHLAGGAPEAIEILSGFILTAHLHDNNGRDDSHRPPYSGSIEWPATLMAFWKTGYAGPAVFEMAADPDPVAALARAVSAKTRLQAILDDLAQPMVFPE